MRVQAAQAIRRTIAVVILIGSIIVVITILLQSDAVSTSQRPVATLGAGFALLGAILIWRISIWQILK